MNLDLSDLNEPANVHRRRRFLQMLAAFGTVGGVTRWARAEEKRIATPAQTPGPYYPVPAIGKQKHRDTDLTKKLGTDEVAKGEVIVVGGVVVDKTGKPIPKAIVEIWQASSDGRYNHPRDTNKTPLDKKFQYWGRMATNEEGKYEFKTIKPGEYPGRTPHIHFRVMSKGRRELVSQLYFSDEAKKNARDGIYRRLSREERNAVTTELTKRTEKPRAGKFEIVLG